MMTRRKCSEISEHLLELLTEDEHNKKQKKDKKSKSSKPIQPDRKSSYSNRKASVESDCIMIDLKSKKIIKKNKKSKKSK